MSCKYDKDLRKVTNCIVTKSRARTPRAAALQRPLWTDSVLENERVRVHRALGAHAGGGGKNNMKMRRAGKGAPAGEVPSMYQAWSLHSLMDPSEQWASCLGSHRQWMPELGL